MRRLHFDVKIGILQIDTGQPLVGLHDCDNALQYLHLEQDLEYTEVEELQVQDGHVSTIPFGYEEVGAVLPAFSWSGGTGTTTPFHRRFSTSVVST